EEEIQHMDPHEDEAINKASERLAAAKKEAEEWLAIRRKAALEIDPETAEVTWCYGQILDPYGIMGADFPEELDCVGRDYFARSPGSDVWVWFGDLPEETREALDRNWEGLGSISISSRGDVVWNIGEPRRRGASDVAIVERDCS